MKQRMPNLMIFAILVDLFQQVVNEKIKKSLPDMIEREPDAKNNVLNDFDTVRGWTKMLKHLADRDRINEEPSRTFDFVTSNILSKDIPR